MMQSGVLGTGFLLSGGLSRLATGAAASPGSESEPPYGLEGCRSFKEFKEAKKAARQEIEPVGVDPDNPSILFHEYLCQKCGHCDETCTDQMTVSHYCKPAVCIHCGQCTTIRCSVDNPDVQAIYEEFLGKPLGALSHELLSAVGRLLTATPA